MKILTFLLVSIAFWNCAIAAADKQHSEKQTVMQTSSKVKSNAFVKESAENSIGVITLNKIAYQKDDFIQIYNPDGSIWHKFSYYYDDSDGKYDYEKAEFKPFAFHPDYFSLALNCVGEDKTRYEVIVNEESGLKKFVEKDDSTLKFETWEKYILKVFAIGFDREKHPLRELPEDQAKKIDLPKEITFHPIEIKGEWLKVSWSKSKQPSVDSYGWIRWKENNKILIELFYIS